MNLTLLTLALSFPAAPAPAPKPERPSGPPPSIVTISPGAEGLLTILDIDQQMVPQQRTVQVTTNDGRVRQVTQTVMVPVLRQSSRILALDKVEIYGHDGKKLAPADVKKHLSRTVPALLSRNGMPVDRFYLRMVREGTLILVIPPAHVPPPGNIPKPKPRPRPVEKLPVQDRGAR